MSIDLSQKICPKCGQRAIKIDKDKYARRICACGYTWYPSKVIQ